MKTQNKIFISLFLLILVVNFNLSAQVNSNNPVNNAIQGENAFLDASTNFNDANSIGKGLVFPTTDLTTFTFKIDGLDTINFPTALNGMIVYNANTGNTVAAVDGNNGIVTAVTPGYYYFYNPGATDSVTAGKWLALGGSSASKEVTSTESTSGLKVNGAQVYSITGTFEASGSSTAVSVTVPAGMTGYYSMVTYKDGKTFRSTIYSFDIASSTNNVICGTGVFSEVLPAGTYSYVLEYFK